MLIRFATALTLLVFPLAAAAQITLDQGDFPLRVGSNPYVNLATENESGANTAALEALIAQSGPGQTYDMTTIVFEEELMGTIDVEPGAVGPAAEAEPLNLATITATFPFMLNEDDLNVEGTIYFYHLIDEDAAYELGSFFLGETDEQIIPVLITNTPAGQLDAEFPYTVGSMWSSMFTQVINFDGFEISSEVEETSEVDGWGTLIVPGVEGGVPALRVKVTTTITTNSVETTDVCYELRTAQPLAASVCEGNATFGAPPTADVSRVGVVSTAGEESGGVLVSALGPAYPNPARESVTFDYVVPQGGKVVLTLFDVLGRPVNQRVEGVRPPGAYSLLVDVTGLPSGLYMARLSIGSDQWVRPVQVVR